ncbi:rna family protein [Cystoisospora suis]|uniref:Rna family protein n=1 Tax=Cystoisospora suis TaxID=483139 RepID=A0A2C6KN90_9APIC|nr:rna family protein [Cystoisospora suis]
MAASGMTPSFSRPGSPSEDLSSPVCSLVSFCSQLAHLSIPPARARPLLEAYVSQLATTGTVTTRTGGLPHDNAGPGSTSSTPPAARLFVSTEHCKASLCSQLSIFLRDTAHKLSTCRTGTATRHTAPTSAECSCGSLLHSEGCPRSRATACLDLPVLIQLLEAMKSLLESFLCCAFVLQSSIPGSPAGEMPSVLHVSPSSPSPSFSTASSTPCQRIRGYLSSASAPDRFPGGRSSLSCSLACEACLSLWLLVSSLSSESSSSTRISKAEKKAKRAEKQTQKSTKRGGPKDFRNGSCPAKQHASLELSFNEEVHEVEEAQRADWGASKPSDQDRHTALRSATEALVTGLFLCSFPHCSSTYQPGDCHSQASSSRCFLNKKATRKSVIATCDVSVGSHWVLHEFLVAVDRRRSGTEKEELGLQDAEEREKTAASLTRPLLAQGAGSFETRADIGRKENLFKDTKADPEHTALDVHAAVVLLDCWLTVLWQRNEKDELCKLSLHLLPVLHELCTLPTFQAHRQCLYGLVLPHVVRRGLPSHRAHLFLLSVISTILDDPKEALTGERTEHSTSQEVVSGRTPCRPFSVQSDAFRTKSDALLHRADAYDLAVRFPDLVFAFSARDSPSLVAAHYSRRDAEPDSMGSSVGETPSEKTVPSQPGKVFEGRDSEGPDVVTEGHAATEPEQEWHVVENQEPAVEDRRWVWLLSGLVDALPVTRKRARHLLKWVQQQVQQPLLTQLLMRSATSRKCRGVKKTGEAGRGMDGASDVSASEANCRLSHFAEELRTSGLSPTDQETGWRCFMQLLEALEDFSQHLVKQQWQHMRRLCVLASKVALQSVEVESPSQGQGQTLDVFRDGGDRGKAHPEEVGDGSSSNTDWALLRKARLSGVNRSSFLILQPLWVEIILQRILTHDNGLLTRSLLLAFLSMCVDDARGSTVLQCFLSAGGKHLREPEGTKQGSSVRSPSVNCGAPAATTVVTAWNGRENLAAEAAYAAAVVSCEGAKGQEEKRGPPLLLCLRWQFFLSTLLPKLSSSCLYSRSSDSHFVESLVREFVRASIVLQYVVRASYDGCRVGGRSFDPGTSLHFNFPVVDGKLIAKGKSGREEFQAFPLFGEGAPATSGQYALLKDDSGASASFSPFGLDEEEDIRHFFVALSPQSLEAAAEASVGDFVSAASACNLTYTPFRVWFDALNSLDTLGNPVQPIGVTAEQNPSNSSCLAFASLGTDKPPRADVAPSDSASRNHFALARGLSRRSAPDLVKLLLQLLQHMPAPLRGRLLRQLLRTVVTHAQPGALSALDVALLLADCQAGLTEPLLVVEAEEAVAGGSSHLNGQEKKEKPGHDSERSSLRCASRGWRTLGLQLLLALFPEPTAFKRIFIGLFRVLLEDEVQSSGETGALEDELLCLREHKSALSEKVATGWLRAAELSRVLEPYSLMKEASELLLAPQVLRVYSRPLLEPLAVRSKLAALAAFLRSCCASSPSSLHPGFDRQLPLLAGEVTNYVLAHIDSFRRHATSAAAKGESRVLLDAPNSAFSAEALCANLSAYTSCLRSFCLLLKSGGGVNCTAVLINRCEEIVQAWGVQPSLQTHPSQVLLVAAALCLLSAAVPRSYQRKTAQADCRLPVSAGSGTDMAAVSARSWRLFLGAFLCSINRAVVAKQQLESPGVVDRLSAATTVEALPEEGKLSHTSAGARGFFHNSGTEGLRCGCLFFAAASRSNPPQLAALSVSSLSPVAVPVLLHPPDGSDIDEDVCAFSSLFTVTESGSFSAWPSIVATFHRARVALMDAVCRSSPTFLRTAVHSEMRFQSGFQETETQPLAQVFTMGPDRVVSPVTRSEPRGSSAQQKALFGDLCNLPPQLFASLEARALDLERSDPESYSLISSRVFPAVSACGVVALGLLAEAGNSHPSAVAGLYRVIRQFSLPVLLLPRLLVFRSEDVVFSERVTTAHDAPPRRGPPVLGNRDPGFSIEMKVHQDRSDGGVYELLTDFTEQSMSIIVDRGETSLPLDAIREVCCAMTDPLMLEAEALYGRLLGHRTSPESQEKDNTPNPDLGASRGLFVYDFVKSLLHLGRSHLAVSRSIVIPLLSSILLTGINRESLLSDWQLPAVTDRGGLQGVHMSFCAAGSGRPLPQAYIELLTEILLHREYVLLDGASATAGDVFGQNSRWFKQTKVSPSLSEVTCFGSSEPAALFRVETSAPGRPQSFFPMVLPAQVAQFRQTPAFVRLFTLSFFHTLGCLCMQTSTFEYMETEVDLCCRPNAAAVQPQTPAQAWASTLLSRVYVCLLEVATSSGCQPGNGELPPSTGPLADEAETGDGAAPSTSAEIKTSEGRASLHHLPMPNSCQHRMSLRAWQALAAFSVFLPCLSPDIWTHVRLRLWSAFAAPQLADVRHFLDLVAVQVLCLSPSDSAPALVKVLKSFNAPTQTLISALSVAGFLLLNPDSVKRKYGHSEQAFGRVCQDLLAAVVPYLTSNAAYCRGVAQYVVFEYLRRQERTGSALLIGYSDSSVQVHGRSKDNSAGYSVPLSHPPVTSSRGRQDCSEEIGLALLRGLYTHLLEAKECHKMRTKCGEVFRLWQPNLMASLGAFLPAVPDSEETGLGSACQGTSVAASLYVPSGNSPECRAATGQVALTVAKTVLEDFDLRPSWSLAVALKDVIKEEMAMTYHGRHRQLEEDDPALTLQQGHQSHTSSAPVSSNQGAPVLQQRDSTELRQGCGEAEITPEGSTFPRANLPTAAVGGDNLQYSGGLLTTESKDQPSAPVTVAGRVAATGEEAPTNTCPHEDKPENKYSLVCQRKFVPEDKDVQGGQKEEGLSPWLYVSGDRETLRRHLRRRGDLVVVASLIDKVPNLAGLARTCEVFDAKKLVIHNRDVLTDPQFNTIGVSAHQWLPIEQACHMVSVGALASYLLDLKEAGYRVVGVEQTGSSQMLQDFRFTRRTALVLGAEKEGLPASLLALMDDCVEIPQLGLIRSLNVHVTGAMVVWEYTKQQALAG